MPVGSEGIKLSSVRTTFELAADRAVVKQRVVFFAGAGEKRDRQFLAGNVVDPTGEAALLDEIVIFFAPLGGRRSKFLADPNFGAIAIVRKRAARFD